MVTSANTGEVSAVTDASNRHVVLADASNRPAVIAQPQRKRSTIRFPYFDLNDAVTVARTLHDNRGGRCDMATLAADLGHDNVQSGSFRLRLSAASMYGVIDQTKGEVLLTPLGSATVDPHSEAEARVTAFLNVPLYERVYREYKSGMLPQEAGLEAKISELGVTANQVTRARQIFMRAADQAGFFKAGRNRLVLPAVATLGDAAAPSKPIAPQHDEQEHVNVEGAALANALLSALLSKMLPDEGKAFSARDRRRFFRALAVNLDVVYGEPDDGQLDAEKLAELFRVDDRSTSQGQRTAVE